MVRRSEEIVFPFLAEKIPGAKNFRWGEALYLNQWDIFCFPSKKQKSNIVEVAEALQGIRTIFECPIFVTSWLRPPAYNKQIGGARFSAHQVGSAVDFYIEGYNCDEVREILLPMLSRLNIRMENLPNANWVHIDKKCSTLTTDSERYFKP